MMVLITNLVMSKTPPPRKDWKELPLETTLPMTQDLSPLHIKGKDPCNFSAVATFEPAHSPFLKVYCL